MIRCEVCGHRLGEWSTFVEDAPRRVHLLAHWYPDGEVWRRGTRCASGQSYAAECCPLTRSSAGTGAGYTSSRPLPWNARWRHVAQRHTWSSGML